MLLVASTDCDKGSDTAYRGGKVGFVAMGELTEKLLDQ